MSRNQISQISTSFNNRRASSDSASSIGSFHTTSTWLESEDCWYINGDHAQPKINLLNNNSTHAKSNKINNMPHSPSATSTITLSTTCTSQSHNQQQQNNDDQQPRTPVPRYPTSLMTTPVFVHDPILSWRPAELLLSKPDESNNVAFVTLSHWNVMDYSTNLTKRHATKSNLFRTRSAVGSPLDRKNNNTTTTPRHSTTSNGEIIPTPSTPVSDLRRSYQSPPSDDRNGPRRSTAGNNARRTPPPPSAGSTVSISLNSYDNGALPLQDVDATGVMTTRDDMTDLPYLHEASILYNLAVRHEKGLPYTRAGVVICAMNPFRWIDGLYGERTRRLYADHFVWHPTKNHFSPLPPHVYEASSLAYRGLITEGQDQSILVSGETGAGKTETVKILMSHLATFEETRLHSATFSSTTASDATPDDKENINGTNGVAGRTNRGRRGSVMRGLNKMKRLASTRRSRPVIEDEEEAHPTIPAPSSTPSIDPYAAHSTHSIDPYSSHSIRTAPPSSSPTPPPSSHPLVRKILSSVPLLESFGNAKTCRNDNSSRFSKYTRLQFALDYRSIVPRCSLVGSRCDTYLLQKNRVCHFDNASGERTFHIFYQLLASDERTSVWEGLDGRGPGDFRYVGVPGTDAIEGMTDAERWEDVTETMEVFGMGEKVKRDLMRSLCLILQLGNVEFEAEGEGSRVKDGEELRRLSDLWGVEEETLEVALTCKTMVTPDDVYKVPLDPTHAINGRDALAKEIYSKIFDWLVNTINSKTAPDPETNTKNQTTGIIGLLDVFGFETLDSSNRFEQLLVNHANEKLQYKFTHDLLLLVRNEYLNEGVTDLTPSDIPDNSPVLSLIEGRGGLLPLLNEETFRPRGNDATYVNKVYATIGTDGAPLFKRKTFSPIRFGVKHYAGDVVYDAEGFVSTNRDALPKDLIRCALDGNNELVAGEFRKDERSREDWREKTIVGVSVWSKFQDTLDDLVDVISRTNARYVRCIVPNMEKKPEVTDFAYAVKQLRYAGVMSAITISRASFPNRMLLDVAYDRFGVLHRAVVAGGDKKKGKNTKPPRGSEIKEMANELMNHVLKDLETKSESDDGQITKAFICGSTRVYFRSGALEYLEGQRLLLFEKRATVIQCLFRRWKALARYTVLKKEADMLKGQRKSLSKYKSFRKSLGRFVGTKSKSSTKKIMDRRQSEKLLRSRRGKRESTRRSLQ